MPGGWYVMLTAALTQPAGRRFPPVRGRSGPAFAAHLRVSDIRRSARIYREGLGMRPLLDLTVSEGFYHELWSLRAGTPVRLLILRGRGIGTGLGSIELPQRGTQARAPAAGPAESGVMMVTYASADVAAA